MICKFGNCKVNYNFIKNNFKNLLAHDYLGLTMLVSKF